MIAFFCFPHLSLLVEIIGSCFWLSQFLTVGLHVCQCFVVLQPAVLPCLLANISLQLLPHLSSGFLYFTRPHVSSLWFSAYCSAAVHPSVLPLLPPYSPLPPLVFPTPLPPAWCLAFGGPPVPVDSFLLHPAWVRREVTLLS